MNFNPIIPFITKARLMTLAEIMDAYRVFPRFFLFGYMLFCGELGSWFMSLPKPTGEQTTFATAIIGLAVPLTGWYMQTGRKWQ